MNKKLILLIFLLGLAMPAAAYVSPRVDVLNLRANAMGGARIAVVDDQYCILNNPAGPVILALETERTRWVSIVQAHAVVSGDFLSLFDKMDNFQAVASGSSAIDNETWNYLSRLKVSFGSTPLFVSLVNILPLEINVAVFNSFKLKMNSQADIPVPSWDMFAFNDTVFVVNWGMPLMNFKYSDLFAGINFKLVNRFQFTRERMDLFQIYNFTELDWEYIDVRRALGFGGDFGLMLTFGEKRETKLSLMINDFFGTRFAWNRVEFVGGLSSLFDEGTEADSSMIDPSFHFGISHRIGTIVPKIIDDLVVAADIQDFLNFDEFFFLKLFFGVEFRSFGFLDVRFGFYQGWITAGIGINIPAIPLELVFAYWGEELGEYPGQNRLDNLAVTLNLVF